MCMQHRNGIWYGCSDFHGIHIKVNELIYALTKTMAFMSSKVAKWLIAAFSAVE